MKKSVAVLVALLAMGCGRKGDPGDRGLNGADAPPTPYTVTGVLDPCGDAPGIQDEVLLRLANGQTIALFAANVNGDYSRLAILSPGTYSTTDGSGCVFTLHADGSVT